MEDDKRLKQLGFYVYILLRLLFGLISYLWIELIK